MMDCIIVETVNGRPVLWEREPNDPALDEEIERIQTIPSDKDLFCIYDVSINAGTLQSIMATRWFHGEAVEGYLRAVAAGKPGFLVFSPYFYLSLKARGEKAALKLFRKAISQAKEKEVIRLVFPLHLIDHWTMAIYNKDLNTLYYYDSCRNEPLQDTVFVLTDLLEESGIAARLPRVRFVMRDPRLFTQTNGYDCGPFICSFGRAVIEDISFGFREDDMQDIRRSILYTILRASKAKNEVPMESEPYYEDIDSEEDFPELETEEERVKLEQVTDRVDELSMNKREKKARVTGSRIYRPSYEELEKARSSNEPFVDIDAEGQEYTANTGGDWRKCLKLEEVLERLASNREEAWRLLEKEILGDARIMFVWVSKVAPVYSSPTPYSFRFGTFEEFKHLKMLVETSFPTLLIKNPHKAVPRSA